MKLDELPKDYLEYVELIDLSNLSIPKNLESSLEFIRAEFSKKRPESPFVLIRYKLQGKEKSQRFDLWFPYLKDDENNKETALYIRNYIVEKVDDYFFNNF